MEIDTNTSYLPREFPKDWDVYYRVLVRWNDEDHDDLNTSDDFEIIRQRYPAQLAANEVEVIYVVTDDFEVDGIRYRPGRTNPNSMRFYNWRGDGGDTDTPYHHTANCRYCGKDMVIDEDTWLRYGIVDCVCQRVAWFRFHQP